MKNISAKVEHANHLTNNATGADKPKEHFTNMIILKDGFATKTVIKLIIRKVKS